MSILTVIGLGVLSFALSAMATPVIRNMAQRRALLDHPDGDLKPHKRAVPRLGGLAMFLGFVASTVLGRGALDAPLPGLYAMLVATTLVVALGLLDDVSSTSAYLRLAVQLVAAIIVMASGALVQFIPCSVIAMPLTAFYLMGGVNSMNLLDGLDGLAAGVSAVAAGGFIVLAALREDVPGMMLAANLLGCSLGFLCYNFAPASIFMGDCGSTFLGFLLALLAVRQTEKPYDVLGFLAPLLVLAIPICDSALAIGRRAWNRKPLFVGDRSHLYDRMVDSGLSVPATALLCYLAGAVGAGLGIALTVLGIP